jgi:hypothetical protein
VFVADVFLMLNADILLLCNSCTSRQDEDAAAHAEASVRIAFPPLVFSWLLWYRCMNLLCGRY